MKVKYGCELGFKNEEGNGGLLKTENGMQFAKKFIELRDVIEKYGEDSPLTGVIYDRNVPVTSKAAERDVDIRDCLKPGFPLIVDSVGAEPESFFCGGYVKGRGKPTDCTGCIYLKTSI